MLKQFFRPRWILTTLLVLAGVAVLVRLGIWQLDRLAQRRQFNARVNAAIVLPRLDLTADTEAAGLFDMEYRSVAVEGEYDPAQQVLLRNQAWNDQPGYHLLTPLMIKGASSAVLVDRGWIPVDQAGRDGLSQFARTGLVRVQGVIRRPQARPDFGGVPDPTLQPGQNRLEAWNIINLDRIQQQVDVALLPVYIQEAPDPAETKLPHPAAPTLDLTEGPHFGYALQWFTFAVILGLGYPFFVRKQLLK